jgi:hypothetical protein
MRAQLCGTGWRPTGTGSARRIWLYANASLFLAEDNPEFIATIRRKAEVGMDVRIIMADPDRPPRGLMES